jgi:LCP family protein required for cell wall assembly
MHALYPNGYDCGSPCLINAVHTLAEGRKDLYPNAKYPGLQATIEAVEGATNLKVNYYVMVNLKGFRDIIDAVGGIEVDVKSRIPMFGSTTVYKQEYIEPGKQVLSGREALWYGRSRYQTDDYIRMGRQKCLMSYMAEQLSPQKVVLNAQQIAASSKKLLRTNIPAQELGQFADLALKSRGKRISTVSLVPPAVSVVTPDFDQIHRMIKTAIRKSEAIEDPDEAGATDESPEPSPSRDPRQNPGTVGKGNDPREANSTDDLAETC